MSFLQARKCGREKIHSLPPKLLVPGGVVPWLLEQARTLFKYHEHEYLLKVLGDSDPNTRPCERSLSLLWTRAVSHKHELNEDSVCDLALSPVFAEETPCLSAIQMS